MSAVKYSYQLGDWTSVIEYFGTHFLYKTKCGGRMSAQFFMNNDNYSYLRAGDYDFETGASNILKSEFGLQNLTQSDQLDADYFQSFLFSKSFFRVGGEIPKNSSSPVAAWAASVRKNLSAVDYQVYPLTLLFSYREFSQLNSTLL